VGVAKSETAKNPTNAFPYYDASDNPTNCCPRFKPEGWDSQDLHFEDKLFVVTETKSVMHVPLNMGKVFSKTFEAITNADALDMDQCIVLSREISPWAAEHFFAVNKSVPGEDMDRLSGDFHTMVFEGPYSDMKHYHEQLIESVGGDKHNPPDTYFFYTTCPKCVKAYGKNYIVGFVETKS
jgi:hypothetical protein